MTDEQLHQIGVGLAHAALSKCEANQHAAVVALTEALAIAVALMVKVSKWPDKDAEKTLELLVAQLREMLIEVGVKVEPPPVSFDDLEARILNKEGMQ